MPSRSEQLKAIAKDFCRVHDEWVEDSNKPAPDEGYWGAVDRLIESFGTGEIPAECRRLADAVDRFATEVEKFDGRENPSAVYPGEDFWAARERIAMIIESGESDAKSVDLKPLESIASLVAKGVNDITIAKIYGFRDRKGNWLTGLVQKEIDQPGSVLKTEGAIDGRTWSDPRLPDPSAGNEVAERHATALADKRRKADAKKARKPCPESPRDLWQQKVPVAQAASMLVQDEAAVAAMFAGFDAEQEAALIGGEAPDAKTQAIFEMSDAGKTIKQIVEELKIGPDKVAAALKARKAAAVGAGAA